MKTTREHFPNQIADFVVQRDVFGLIKNAGISVTKKMKYKSIDAPDLDVTYAGIGRRIVSTFIDLFTVLSVTVILSMVLFPSNQMSNYFMENRILIGLFIWILYNGFFESSVYEATIGEMLFKLKVIDLYGKQVSFLRASFRCIVTILSILPVGLGIWYMTTDPKKQSWHDLIAGTFVIKSK